MITAVLSGRNPLRWARLAEELHRNPLLRKTFVLQAGEPGDVPPRCDRLAVADPLSGGTWNRIQIGRAHV